MPRIAHKPTEEGRRQVEDMSGYGVRQEVICKVMRVSLPTLHKYYRDELDAGDGRAQAAIGEALYDKAVVGRDTASLIFLAKVRLGFKETTRVENTGADGGPIQVKEEDVRKRIAHKLNRLRVVGNLA